MFVALAEILCAPGVSAQMEHLRPTLEPPQQVKFDGASVELPIESIGNLPVVSLRVNGKGPTDSASRPVRHS